MGCCLLEIGTQSHSRRRLQIPHGHAQPGRANPNSLKQQPETPERDCRLASGGVFYSIVGGLLLFFLRSSPAGRVGAAATLLWTLTAQGALSRNP